MIRTTYRGRPIKVLKSRTPNCVKLVINDRIISHGWQGDDAQALDWFRRIIDKIEANGGAGMVAMLIPNQYTEPHWYEPGTIDVNPKGHATKPGGVCMCARCTTGEVNVIGDQPRFAPLAPDACRYCHQSPAGHRHDVNPLTPHRYTEPTPAQLSGRQAALREAAR